MVNPVENKDTLAKQAESLIRYYTNEFRYTSLLSAACLGQKVVIKIQSIPYWFIPAHVYPVDEHWIGIHIPGFFLKRGKYRPNELEVHSSSTPDSTELKLTIRIDTIEGISPYE